MAGMVLTHRHRHLLGSRRNRHPQGPLVTKFAWLRSSRTYIDALTLLFIAALIVIGTRAYDTLQTRQLTQCQFNRDLGNLAKVKVALNPKTHKASKVGIAIVADSRAAFRGLGCRGELDKPGPSFIHWARIYKLPAN
ncbi:MAG TPA: hypothetical protein VF506_18405 [Streptosporangiaceae bacterium]